MGRTNHWLEQGEVHRYLAISQLIREVCSDWGKEDPDVQRVAHTLLLCEKQGYSIMNVLGRRMFHAVNSLGLHEIQSLRWDGAVVAKKFGSFLLKQSRFLLTRAVSMELRSSQASWLWRQLHDLQRRLKLPTSNVAVITSELRSLHMRLEDRTGQPYSSKPTMLQCVPEVGEETESECADRIMAIRLTASIFRLAEAEYQQYAPGRMEDIDIVLRKTIDTSILLFQRKVNPVMAGIYLQELERLNAAQRCLVKGLEAMMRKGFPVSDNALLLSTYTLVNAVSTWATGELWGVRFAAMATVTAPVGISLMGTLVKLDAPPPILLLLMMGLFLLQNPNVSCAACLTPYMERLLAKLCSGDEYQKDQSWSADMVTINTVIRLWLQMLKKDAGLMPPAWARLINEGPDVSIREVWVRLSQGRLPYDAVPLCLSTYPVPPFHTLVIAPSVNEPLCCSNVMCLNMSGASDYHVKTYRCNTCPSPTPARYCSRKCQVQAWRGGHSVAHGCKSMK